VRRFLEVQAPEVMRFTLKTVLACTTRGDQPMVGELVLALRSRKEAALVPLRLRVEHDDVPRSLSVGRPPLECGALAALRQDDGTASRQRRSSLSRPPSWSSCTRFNRR
jgi:hypothetical protein